MTCTRHAYHIVDISYVCWIPLVIQCVFTYIVVWFVHVSHLTILRCFFVTWVLITDDPVSLQYADKLLLCKTHIQVFFARPALNAANWRLRWPIFPIFFPASVCNCEYVTSETFYHEGFLLFCSLAAGFFLVQAEVLWSGSRWARSGRCVPSARFALLLSSYDSPAPFAAYFRANGGSDQTLTIQPPTQRS